MNYNTKIIRFMKKKDEVLRKKGGMHYPYYTEEDYTEVRSWNPICAKRVWMDLVTALKVTLVIGYQEPEAIIDPDYFHMADVFTPRGYQFLLRSKMWPWCVLFAYDSCDGCEYGKRHGICSDPSSGYRKVREEVIASDEFLARGGKHIPPLRTVKALLHTLTGNT